MSTLTAGLTTPRRAVRERLALQLDVTLQLVRVELAARDRGSVLGWLWSLGPPAFMLAATYFLFTRVFPLDIQNYPVFLLAGILPWTWFSRSLSESTTSLENRRELVLRPGFRTELLPVVAVVVGLVDYLIALPVLLLAIGLTTGLHVEALLLPVLLLLQLAFCVGLGLMLAPLQVFFRDVRQLVGMVVALGFWFTPIFYRRTQVPESLSWLYEINPMAHLIESFRAILIAGTVPSLEDVGIVAAAAAIALVLGGAVFARLRHAVPEQL
jgi:ABC-type polysaccharide/polyol phosphate export permease